MFWQLILAACSPAALVFAYGAYVNGDVVQTLALAIACGFGIGCLLCFTLVDASSHNFNELKKLTKELLAENARLKKRVGQEG
jgi:hypothetical protein